MNSTTKYYAYGDSDINDRSDLHSIHHCEYIEELPNVSVYKEDDFDIKEYRNSGRLAVDFRIILYENDINV